MSEHKSQEYLKNQLDNASSLIEIGGIYSHYKNSAKHYLVMDLGIIEETEEICVIYQAKYGEKLIFVRPLSVWLEDVNYEGKVVPRFCKVNI